MATLLAPPPARLAVPAPARRSRVLPWVIAVLLVVAGLVGSLLLWAPSTAAVRAGQVSFAGQAEVVTLPQYGASGTHVVNYEHGAAVELTVPLRNDGPLPVTVTAVATDAGVMPLLEVREQGGVPVALGPGETADVTLRGVLGNCRYYHEREVQNVYALVVTTEVLGQSVRQAVPLDRPLLVKSPMIVDCPDRLINRQADNKRDVL